MEEQQPTRPIRLWTPDVNALVCVRDLLRAAGQGPCLPRQEAVQDRYLDTQDWWLYRAGLVCRLRNYKDQRAIRLKPLVAGEAVLPADGPMDETLPDGAYAFPGPLPGTEISGWLNRLMPMQDLLARLELNRRREVYDFTALQGGTLTAYVDTVMVVRRGFDVAFAEITLSAEGAAQAALPPMTGQLAEQCGMQPAIGPALQRALDLMGVQPLHLEEGPELSPGIHDRFVDAAYRVLRRHFQRMLWHEPGARVGMNPEAVHDMRVACRRMQAALRVFQNALPARRANGLRRDLKWLRRVLGEVRNLDVYLVHLAERSIEMQPDLREALDLYVADLRTERAKARESMLQTLATRKYGRLLERMHTMLDTGPPRRPTAMDATKPAAIAAREEIISLHDKVLKDGRKLNADSPNEAFHKLRIKCKRLRYACEFFQEMYGKPIRKFISRLKKLQDILGENQDAVVAREQLQEYAEARRRRRSADYKLYMALGTLMAYHDGRMRDARGAFQKRWAKFDRGKVRNQLVACLDRHI